MFTANCLQQLGTFADIIYLTIQYNFIANDKHARFIFLAENAN